MSDPIRLLSSEIGEAGIVARDAVRRPVGLAMSDEKQIHVDNLYVPYVADSSSCTNTMGTVARDDLVEHLISNALRTDGPFTLRSGMTSDWYLDARQTTFDGRGARLVGEAVLSVLDREVEAVGGMTMGADPIAIATAMTAAEQGRDLKAFSIRKEPKDHGTGGRIVGPVDSSLPVAVLEDTTTTGSAAVEAARYLLEEGFRIVQAIALVDRSNGAARDNFRELGIEHLSLLVPDDLGVAS